MNSNEMIIVPMVRIGHVFESQKGIPYTILIAAIITNRATDLVR